MNKISIILLCISFFYSSCKNDIPTEESENSIFFEKQVKNDNSLFANIDGIDNILNIPVNIVLEAAGQKFYLGYPEDCNPKKVLLYDKDYLTGFQQWVISKNPYNPQNYIVSLVRDPSFPSPLVGPYYLRLNDGNPPYVQADIDVIPGRSIGENSSMCHILFLKTDEKSKFSYITNEYQTFYIDYGANDFFNYGVYLSSTNPTNKGNLDFKNNKNIPENQRRWEIIPVDIFNLEKIEYHQYVGDAITAMPDFMTNASIENSTSVEQSMTIQFSEKATEQSSFSETEGQSISIKAGTTIGIPSIISGNLEMSTVSSTSCSFENGETKEDSRSYTFPIKVAPFKKVYAEAIVKQYKASLSYTATFKGLSTKKIITLSGKWNGIKAGEISYKLREEPTGKIIMKFTGTPQKTIDLTKL